MLGFGAKYRFRVPKLIKGEGKRELSKTEKFAIHEIPGLFMQYGLFKIRGKFEIYRLLKMQKAHKAY